MFFMFAGATQDVRKVLQKTVVPCPRCDGRANLVDYETVFRIFLLPVYRHEGDNPAIFCPRCKLLLPWVQYQAIREATIKSFQGKGDKD